MYITFVEAHGTVMMVSVDPTALPRPASGLAAEEKPSDASDAHGPASC